MKKAISIILALSMLCTCVSCSSVKSQSQDESSADISSGDTSTAEKVFDNGITAEDLKGCFKRDEITLPDNAFRLGNYIPIYGTDDAYISLGEHNMDAPYKTYKTDRKLSYFELIEYELPDKVKDADAAYSIEYFLSDGTFLTLITAEDHGGMTLPETYDESFDFESYYNNCTSTYYIAKYDKDCNMISCTEMEFPEEFGLAYDDTLYYGRYVFNDTLILTTVDGSFWTLDAEGNFNRIKQGEGYDENGYSNGLPALLRDGSGGIIAIKEKTVDDMESGYIQDVNEVSRISDDFTGEEKLFELNYIQYPYDGYGDYIMLTRDETGLFGFKADGTKEEIINWLNSDCSEMTAYPCGDGTFIGFEESSSTGRATAYRLTPRDPSEFKDTVFVTVTYMGNAVSNKLINKFNNMQSDCRIKCVSLLPEDADSDKPIDYTTPLNLALVSGNAPDIIIGLSNSEYQNYRKKGVFADLTPFIETSSTVNRETLMPNLLTALSNKDGQLFSLTPSYSIGALVTKKKFYDKEGWSFSDMINFYDNLPDEMTETYSGQTKEEMLEMLMYSIADLIDYENGTTSLDGQELIDILEFCNRFMIETEHPTKADDGWNAWETWFYDKQMWFANDRIPLKSTPLDAPSYAMTKYFYANGDELSFVGYPSDDNKGGRIFPSGLITMNESCKNKDEAWKFIEYLMLNSYTSEDSGTGFIGGIPAVVSLWDKELEKQKVNCGTFSGNKCPLPTDDDIKRIKEYNLTCDRLGTVIDEDTKNIIMEEAGLCFIGEQSVETAADHINNRVSILVSERS